MPAEPLYRYQSSLEGILDFLTRPPLSVVQYQAAARKFAELIDHFDQGTNQKPRDKRYDRVTLVRLTYEYARTEESKGNFLRAFFESAGTPVDDNLNAHPIDLSNPNTEAALRDSIHNFADYLFENFFLPLKASARKTPQPSPASHSAVLSILQEPHTFLGTPDRVAALRGACLIRDHHRCVITRLFDCEEAEKRINSSRLQGIVALDDEGNPFTPGNKYDLLQVAHILPHSLTQLSANNDLNNSKAAALAILNMFDHGAAHLIEGTDIDRPGNAITVTIFMRQWFGNFKVFFEPVEQQAHTYRIDTFSPMILGDVLPVTRTLYLTESRTIDPPSPRLLAIHKAIAHILHLSAAGAYIDKILRDLEDQSVREDGSSELDLLVKLKLQLQGWPAGQAAEGRS
ncbi:unnamed protein product [Clonostachys rhizophaga]|uniref:HNH nuclease domain-containing protein n=1 Tax=Clonostachys rhizophaga TaxID=160324 RepID=A0A9N9YMB7_9HYPO|nr:unnamed protein product [Clonostachys rhizophaga]